MADEKVKSRTGFLSKLQRSKSTKDDVDKDLADFLKPSTDKAVTRPRIDIAIAKRWPEAQSVENPDALPSFETPQNVNALRKKRRKEGLVVGFVATAPEIIGEGGDESPYPTIEISRSKARNLPPPNPQTRPRGQTQVLHATNDRSEQHEQLRRANTSREHHRALSQQPQYNEPIVPTITTNDLDIPNIRESDSPLSQHDRKRSLMTANEGMALRRASSIVNLDALDDNNDDNDNEDSDDAPPHFGPGPGLKNFSLPSRGAVPSQATSRPSEIQASRVPQLKETDGSRNSASPFDDPKYLERRGQPRLAPRPSAADRDPAPQRYPGQVQYTSSSRLQPGTEAARQLDTKAESHSPQYVPYTNTAHNHSQASLQRSSFDQRSASSTTQASITRPDRSPLAHIDAQDPSSTDTDRGNAVSLQSSSLTPSEGEAALTNFAARVAHMKGVFQLTAQKERPSDQCTAEAWLRTACWWYLMGKLGLEHELRLRAHSKSQGDRELLLQGHVDLAKAWWILVFPLQLYGKAEDRALQETAPHLRAIYAELLGNMQGLCLSLGRNNIMPPSASLIQGQDTRIWLLETNHLASPYLEQSGRTAAILDALPLGDSKTQFCYSRFPVSVALGDSHGNVDQTTISCLLTVVRSRDSYHTDIVVAGQDERLTVKVSATSNGAGISWQDVSWNMGMSALTLPLPDGTSLHARMQQNDYKSLGNMVEYTRNAIRTMQAAQHERLLYKAHLALLAYSASSGPPAFHRSNLDHCLVLVFAAQKQHGHTYRTVLVTDPSVKILSCVSHEIADFDACLQGGSQSPPSITMGFVDSRKEARATLTFHNTQDMLAFQALGHDGEPKLRSGPPAVTPNAMPTAAPIPGHKKDQSDGFVKADPLQQPRDQICSVPLLDHEIGLAAEVLSFDSTPVIDSSPLQWREVSVFMTGSADDVEHEHSPDGIGGLKAVHYHANGSFTDRLTLQQGELALRLDSALDMHSIAVLREPQPSFDADVNVQSCHPAIATAIGKTVKLARQESTIRTSTFSNLESLHKYQAAITGFDVRYDGHASSFAISRRRMVVPIHHKWIAADVRLQVVSNAQGTVVKILAFMSNFDHAEAMCFQVKSTDVFEKNKGDSKGKKWSIKLVDAKFSLPAKAGKKESEIAVKSRRRFINLDGLEYAEEHDDITIGFDREEGEVPEVIKLQPLMLVQIVTASLVLFQQLPL